MRKFAQIQQPEGLPDVKKKEPAVEPPQKKLSRILVVDDDASIRKLMCAELGDYHVAAAVDGLTGLELFKSGEFDLVVTDLKMPNMSGMELLAEIKMIDPKKKVIVISGFMGDDTKEMLLQMGADLVLEKPMGVVQIAEHVARVLPN